MTRHDIRIGIDLGGAKIEAAALGPQGETLARRRAPTPVFDYEAILRAICALVSSIEGELGARGALGVAIPGMLSPREGVVKNSFNTGLNGKPLDRDLSQLLDRPVRVGNDANCFALSEATDGAGAGARVVFGVILGTGVGGGIVVDGAVIEGCNGVAGEWGHNPLPWMGTDEFPGRRCSCGRLGCIETFLSGSGLAHDYLQRARRRQSPRDIAQAASTGDPLAQESLRAYRERLARALASAVNFLDPDVIVLGGGLSNVAAICEGLEKLVEHYAFADAIVTKVTRNSHGDASGVRGAAWLWGGPTPASAR